MLIISFFCFACSLLMFMRARCTLSVWVASTCIRTEGADVIAVGLTELRCWMMGLVSRVADPDPHGSTVN
jgi:hypothetical protein